MTRLTPLRSTILVAGMTMLVAACGHEQAKSDQAIAKSAQPGLFTVPADQMSHVQLFTVEPTSLQRVLRLTGAVTYNGFKTTPVISAVGGPVARILVTPGLHVKRGQPMLYVSSPDFSQLRATYLKASSAFKVADKNFARAQDLYQHHAIAEKDLLDAESARTQAQAGPSAPQRAASCTGRLASSMLDYLLRRSGRQRRARRCASAAAVRCCRPEAMNPRQARTR